MVPQNSGGSYVNGIDYHNYVIESNRVTEHALTNLDFASHAQEHFPTVTVW